ncbi:MAG: hypothetical protein AAGI51_02760, partial [Pseudomonadota bacterium]
MTTRLHALAGAAAVVAVPAAAQSILDAVVLRPEAKVELRLFPEDPQFDGQLEHLQPSLVLTGEASWRSDDRATRALFEPYLRLDGADQERTYFDAREAHVSHAFGDWEALVGASTVFWGVAEAHNPVDVINQIDLLEDIDGDEKLGQPMLRLNWRGDAGSVDLFYLPYFRERAFPGEDGRLRPDPIVAGGRAEFERGGGAWAGDAALRYETRIDDLDLGLHAFYGTSRAPTLEFDPSLGRLTPFYAELAQAGLDAQYTTGPWLLKLEAVAGAAASEAFTASAAGVEYTFFDVAASGLDLGMIGEHLHDTRGRGRSAEPLFGSDVFAGARLTWNDVQDTELLGGAII